MDVPRLQIVRGGAFVSVTSISTDYNSLEGWNNHNTTPLHEKGDHSVEYLEIGTRRSTELKNRPH